MGNFRKFWLILPLFAVMCAFLSADPLDPMKRAKSNAHDHYNLIVDFFQKKAWEKLIWHARMFAEDFPNSPLTREVYYYSGVAFYEVCEYEKANEAFSNYLKEEMSPQFFEKSLGYKFEIARHFQKGERRSLFHVRRFPKWVHDYEKAIEIFDEIIVTVPRSEMAAASLYHKGELLVSMKKYDKSIASFQTLIRRFPKHALTPDSYLGIAKIYLIRSEKEYAASRYLDCARLNLSKFRSHFPLEPRLKEAEEKLAHMENVMAESLLEIGEFYKRTKKGKAAAIYYRTILKKYPNTKAAQVSKKQLSKLGHFEVDPEENAPDENIPNEIAPDTEKDLDQAPLSETGITP